LNFFKCTFVRRKVPDADFYEVKRNYKILGIFVRGPSGKIDDFLIFVILSSKLDVTSKPPSATSYPATVNKGMPFDDTRREDANYFRLFKNYTAVILKNTVHGKGLSSFYGFFGNDGSRSK
jgi:hypothetical protein